MKFSEITEEDIVAYMNEDIEDVDIRVIRPILLGAKSYIKSYTGQKEEFLDTKEDTIIALYVIATEMYENRRFTVEKEKINPMIQSILDMYCINLL